MIECAKTLLGIASLFDPTGIALIAKSFMYTSCDGLKDPKLPKYY